MHCPPWSSFCASFAPLPETPFPPTFCKNYSLPGAPRMRDPVLSVRDAVMNETEDIPASIRFIFKDKTPMNRYVVVTSASSADTPTACSECRWPWASESVSSVHSLSVKWAERDTARLIWFEWIFRKMIGTSWGVYVVSLILLPLDLTMKMQI